MLWDLSTNQLTVIFAFSCAVSFICGWIADRIMGYAGFGVIGNWLLLLAGVYVGLFTYNQLGYDVRWYPLTTLMIAFGSATAMLMTLSGVKSVTHT